ncbi:MAG: hypothetical protein KJ666_02715 [Bacteroidetes bacterium]|nr:hypothetical protein [Bacteroidota bacterium]
MYNWSVDEERFKKEKEIIKFLKEQPEVISVKKENKKDSWGNSIIKINLNLNTHSVRKIFLTHYLADRIDRKLRVSINEAKKLKKEIFK